MRLMLVNIIWAFWCRLNKTSLIQVCCKKQIAFHFPLSVLQGLRFLDTPIRVQTMENGFMRYETSYSNSPHHKNYYTRVRYRLQVQQMQISFSPFNDITLSDTKTSASQVLYMYTDHNDSLSLTYIVRLILYMYQCPYICTLLTLHTYFNTITALSHYTITLGQGNCRNHLSSLSVLFTLFSKT